MDYAGVLRRHCAGKMTGSGCTLPGFHRADCATEIMRSGCSMQGFRGGRCTSKSSSRDALRRGSAEDTAPAK